MAGVGCNSTPGGPVAGHRMSAARRLEGAAGRGTASIIRGKHRRGLSRLYDYRFTSYYEADGWFRSEQGDEKSVREGKWWTNRKGYMCIRWDGESRNLCRKIITDDFGQYKKV